MAQIKGTINQVELLGWLGSDPELRTLANGAAVCRFSIATKRFGPPDVAGQATYDTDWTNVEAWEKLGELCNRALHKGSRVMVMGALRTDSWSDKATNQPRSRTYIRLDQALFLDARPGVPSEAGASAEDAHVGEEVPF